jgi:peptidoglycan/xylan/chitin deacetylase (PgdA/CDA1 family)
MFMQRRHLLASLAAIAICGAGPPAAAETEDRSDRTVALTFDDGPHPELTPRLLDMLAQEKICASFFVIGSCAARSPEIVARAYGAGHEIGNHSWSHPFLTHISLASAGEEISRTDALLHSITGEFPNAIRPPYGAMNEALETLALPRPMLLWDVDTNDWRSRNTPAVEHAAAASNGGIVLMHDIHPTTIEAVPAIICDFKSRGFRFVTISNYIAWNVTNDVTLDQV